jgi:hypothetical protein
VIYFLFSSALSVTVATNFILQRKTKVTSSGEDGQTWKNVLVLKCADSVETLKG